MKCLRDAFSDAFSVTLFRYEFHDVTSVDYSKTYFMTTVKGKDSSSGNLEASYSFNSVNTEMSQVLHESCRQNIIMAMNAPGKWIVNITIVNEVGYNRALVSCKLTRK